MEGTYRGTHIHPPHLEFAFVGQQTQVCGVQVSFRSRSLTNIYQGVVVSVAHMFLDVTYPSFSLIST